MAPHINWFLCTRTGSRHEPWNSLILYLGETIGVQLASTRRLWHKILQCAILTSSNGNIFRVTGPLCGEFTGPGEFHTQRPVTRSFDVFFDLRLNKRLSKQPWGWWFETPSWSLWRQCNAIGFCHLYIPHLPKLYMSKFGRNKSKAAPISLYFVRLQTLRSPASFASALSIAR